MILYKDTFENFATNHLAISSAHVDEYKKLINQTPAVIEEREMRFTLMSVFDRLMADRIIYVGTPIYSGMANIINAQLLYLDSVNNKDIEFKINSPGGEVYAGLSTIDSMELCKSEIITGVNGIAASMASVLLGAGVKGKRTATRFSRVMLHQSSGGTGGNIQDAEVAMIEWKRLNHDLFELLGEYSNKTAEQVKKDATRDLWLSSIEALEYGIVDKVFWSKDVTYTRENLKDLKK